MLQSLIGHAEEKLQQTVDEQAALISELKAQLIARETAFIQAQKGFEQQLLEAETKQQSLLHQVKESRQVQDHLRSLAGDRNELEKTLSHSRQCLLEKLRERQLLEKDLSYHRTELQRRLLEKQRVEELLFEKTRFEQELKKQKETLRIELDSIEKKLMLREVQLESEPVSLSEKMNNSDSLLLARQTETHLHKAQFDQNDSLLSNQHSTGSSHVHVSIDQGLSYEGQGQQPFSLVWEEDS